MGGGVILVYTSHKIQSFTFIFIKTLILIEKFDIITNYIFKIKYYLSVSAHSVAAKNTEAQYAEAQSVEVL